MNLVTPDYLRQILHYEPSTGVFTRKVTLCGRALAGSVVGVRGFGGYLTVKIDDRRYSLHRLAWLYMTGAWPTDQVDHIDGDPANNRFSNLREASSQLNCRNRRRAKRTSSTGLIGVGAQYGKFQASIKVNGKKQHLGTFATKEAAHAAYVATRNRLFPDCAL